MNYTPVTLQMCAQIHSERVYVFTCFTVFHWIVHITLDNGVMHMIEKLIIVV